MHWLRDYLLNVLIVLAILSGGSFVYQQSWEYYYTHAPIETFFESHGLFVSDICFGENEQNIVSTRFVKGTDTGYPAYVIRELFLVERGMQTKVYDEYAQPFVEYSPAGTVTRIQQLPDLRPGSYQWAIKVSIVVGGVVRDDVPLILSNIFQVKRC